MRKKFVHQQGVVGKAVFTVNSAAQSKYTGIFKSGADDVIVRFSETGLHVDDITSSMNPSVAFKFLRNGVHSANQFGMIHFEGDQAPGQEWNWWGKPLLTYLPAFREEDNLDNTCRNIED